MKILYLPGLFPTPENKESGIFIHNRFLTAKKFNNITFDVVIPYTFNSGIMKLIKNQNKMLPDNYNIDGINYHYLKINYKLKNKLLKNYDEMVINCIEKKFDIKSYDVIHAHWTYPMGYYAYLLGKKYKIPYVITAHGSDINHYIDRPELKDKIEISLNNAAQVIFVSWSLAGNARNFNYKSINSTVIPNGTDTKLFKILNKETIKNQLNLTKKVVGFTGNLTEIKRADKLSEIFHKIAEKEPNVQFLVIGDGHLKETLVSECRDLDISFKGKVPQKRLPFYLNAMDIMILPSRNEGFPCVVNEANSCGIPVIGSSNGGIPEAIDDKRFIVNESENFEKDFADKVVSVLSEKYCPEDFRKKSQYFDWEYTVKKELEIYKRIIQKIPLKQYS